MISRQRIASIDIFRAITMLLMIFVNDLWTLRDIPAWLGHAAASEDRLGLADVVFPAFLFIVGLSIPFAIANRREKGATDRSTFFHIFQRSFALIVMGLFMVNYENINGDLLPFSRYYWGILMALAIFFVWTNYRNQKALGFIPDWVMEIIGILIFIFLAVIYRSGTADSPEWMQTRWWGILGLIGWAYLLNALIYLFMGPRIVPAVIILLLFYLLNIQEFNDIIGFRGMRIIVGASNHALVMSGVFASILYIQMKKRNKQHLFLWVLAGLAAVFILYAYAIRPNWGISKIRATPSWTAICAGISFGFYGLLYLIADIYGKTNWAGIIAPAGRSTLTCYLVPYYYYPVLALIGIRLPMYLREGYIGIIKSLLFALLIILITRGLEKLNIRLKV
jgi:heparan-alpha-glucosaminide N-acetyltransferase